MELKKNDKIELLIDSLTSEGSGVGRFGGLAVFVRGTVPQDRITAHIIKRSKNYAIGIVDKILEPSPGRIESDCPYSDKCGGCSFRHMTYGEELKYKRTRVDDALKRIGHLDIEPDEIIGADSINRYRNKAQYPAAVVSGELCAGFYAYKSHRIIPCEDCLLQPDEFRLGVEAFIKWARAEKVTCYDEKTGKGLLRHIYFRKAFATEEIMACTVINGSSLPGSGLLVSLLRDALDGLKSVAVNINCERTNVILGSETKIIYGSDSIRDRLLGKEFVISPNSFYQVNHDQCEKLYAKVQELACFSGEETLLDLYCGTGTIGLTAANSVKRLIGIEIVPQAVENAKLNAKINNIKNARFICSDAYEGAEILKNQGIRPDAVILDPPRKGCEKKLFDAVDAMGARKIIYVSCDCATLARDLEILSEKNYITKKVCPIDMFPRTPHTECVALIEKGV